MKIQDIFNTTQPLQMENFIKILSKASQEEIYFNLPNIKIAMTTFESAQFDMKNVQLSLEDIRIFIHNIGCKKYIIPLLLNHSDFIHCKIGDEKLSVFQLAIKFGLTDLLEPIQKTNRYKIAELATETNGLGVDSYYLAQLHSPYLISFLKNENCNFEEINKNKELYELKRGVFFVAAKKQNYKAMDMIFAEGVIKPYNAHAVMGPDFYFEELPFIAETIKKNDIKAFKVCLQHYSNVFLVFFEKINGEFKPVNLLEKAADLDNKSNHSCFIDLIIKKLAETSEIQKILEKIVQNIH